VRNWRDTRRTYVGCALICACTALLAAASPAAAVDPAVKEYSLTFPNARGKSYPGADTPTARLSEVGPLVRAALEDSNRPDGKALATIATAPELGAPDIASGGALGNPGSGEASSADTPSVLTAAFRAVDDPLVLFGLFAFVGVIVSLAFLARVRRTGN
jgi:hypothetical protein